MIDATDLKEHRTTSSLKRDAADCDRCAHGSLCRPPGHATIIFGYES